MLLNCYQLYSQSIEGRWDITVTDGENKLPSWLEVTHSGFNQFVGHFVGDNGSSRPISKINFKDNKMSFSIPPQWQREEKDLEVEGTFKNDQLSGTLIYPSGKKLNWVGVRAPRLIKMKEPKWGKFVSIFNGKNLDGWQAFGGENQWIVENGILKSPKSGANLKTTSNYGDFKLQLEFRVPKNGNSGVYLRGRHEVQIMDSHGKEPSVSDLGAIYGFVQALDLSSAKPAGEWQTYDITLVGRVVTVVLNGTTIINKYEIPGITGGALDSNEGMPGPIYFQGDHEPIEFRNIKIAVGK